MNILEQALTEAISYNVGEYKPTEDKVRSYCLQNDGLYQIRETKLATYVFKEAKGTYPGLIKQLEEGIQLKIDKLPMRLFNQLWMFFRHINNLHSSEVYVSVYYDKENDEYKFLVPKQSVHGAIAEVNKKDGMEIIEYANKYVHVLETHSHNTMGGKFSTTDDKDQIDINALHLVIGNVDKDVPSYQLRYTLGKRKFNLKLNDLFEVDNELDLGLFPNWKKNIKIKSYGAGVKSVEPYRPHTRSPYRNSIHNGYTNYGGKVVKDSFDDDFSYDDAWDYPDSKSVQEQQVEMFEAGYNNAIDSDEVYDGIRNKDLTAATKNGWKPV